MSIGKGLHAKPMLRLRISRTGPGSLTRFLGAALFGCAFVLGCQGPRSGHHPHNRDVTVEYPALVKNKGITGTVRLKSVYQARRLG